MMKTFKIKGKNCYITIDKQLLDEFNIDSDYTGIVANYEDVAKYFLRESEDIGHKEEFEIEEVEPIAHEIGELFSV